MFRLFQNLIRGTLGLLGGILNGVLGVVGLKPKKTEYFMEYKGDQISESNSGPQPVSQPSPLPASQPKETEAKSANAGKKGSTRKAKAESKPEAPVAVGVAETAVVPTPTPQTQTLNLPTPSVTFAPTYLNPAMNTNGDRRRPGANMGSFLDMARQAKRPV
jgi:hypothetical protein